ncbi:hypothetical protein [Ancylomarina sp. 16SWW S1-10-2]|uniref:RipA family octameric membrane protein n=1 Tax=Ancylomarina sp. 16SWW S1-10-2 TaxID=2499681 RepID=UPI0012AD7178|nr:hypothetical protein [Ancylomarina sp. 16SWW S1-10-2]MRT93129.1 hypothetical protein [Ancylomarina sp. 16SWW S1-10-2]
MEIKKYLIYLKELFIKKRFNYTPLSDDEYIQRFGVKIENGERVVEFKDKLEKAYTKAWENRDFEINKFWTRAAYFWGFIVLIFGGYLTLLTSEHNSKAYEMNLDLYLLLLGFLFSLSWYLVIRGSKGWQENWEAHIDLLEDLVSGPLYKTIHYRGNRFYSVSKLNEILALVIIFVWCGLFYNYASKLTYSLNIVKIDFQITLPIIVTIVITFVLRFGYCKGDYKSAKNKFFDRWKR